MVLEQQARARKQEKPLPPEVCGGKTREGGEKGTGRRSCGRSGSRSGRRRRRRGYSRAGSGRRK
eukprot:403850-Hanusia_phi.AAC.1